MSQENVEIVRAVYDATARRDRDALDAIFAEYLAPEFEFEALLTGLTYQGATGARELVDDIQDTVGYTPEVLEAVDLGEHVVDELRQGEAAAPDRA